MDKTFRENLYNVYSRNSIEQSRLEIRYLIKQKNVFSAQEAVLEKEAQLLKIKNRKWYQYA